MKPLVLIVLFAFACGKDQSKSPGSSKPRGNSEDGSLGASNCGYSSQTELDNALSNERHIKDSDKRIAQEYYDTEKKLERIYLYSVNENLRGSNPKATIFESNKMEMSKVDYVELHQSRYDKCGVFAYRYKIHDFKRRLAFTISGTDAQSACPLKVPFNAKRALSTKNSTGAKFRIKKFLEETYHRPEKIEDCTKWLTLYSNTGVYVTVPLDYKNIPKDLLD